MIHDEDLLERLYWEFDQIRRESGERLAFKGKLRWYAQEFVKGKLNMMLLAQEYHNDKGYEESTHEKQQKFAIRREDPCPGCIPGAVCRTPACGRRKLPLDHPLRTVSYWKEDARN